jgi:alpha-beta hydrolase superfamily lysophospholipase
MPAIKCLVVKMQARFKLSKGVILLATLAAAACSPRLQEIGPPIDQPQFTDTMFHTADGADLPVRMWVQWHGDESRKPLGIILALHGFNDHSGGLALPGSGLSRRGYRIYAYDQRGFGRAPHPGIWPGSEQLIADLRTATHLLKTRFPDQPLYLLGESMGGAVMMAASVESDPPVADGMILVAPAVWGLQTQSAFNRSVLDLAANTVPWMTVVPTGLRIRASSSNAALIAMARDPLVIKETRVDSAYGLVDLMTRAYAAASVLKTPRCMVLFGSHEVVLSRSAVSRVLRQLPNRAPDQLRVALYPKGYHLLLRDWDALTVYDDIAAWLKNPAAPLPSGADVQWSADAKLPPN